MSKFLSLLAGAALLGGVSVANAADVLDNDQMDVVVAGFTNEALAEASAVALGLFVDSYTETYTETTVVHGIGSESFSSSYSWVD